MERLTIACFLPRPLGTYSHSPHIKALAPFCRLVIIEEPVTPCTLLKDYRRVIERFRFGRRCRWFDSGFYLYTPLLFFPVGLSNTFAALRHINQPLLLRQLKRLFNKMDLQLDAALIFMPQQEAIIDGLAARLLCYVLYDNWPAYAEYPPNKQSRMRKSEEKIFDRADLILASSRYLEQLHRQRHRHIELVLNAAEADHFAKARAEDTPLASDIAGLAKPRIGFIGSIEQMVDLDLIAHLAMGHPEWSLVMIGPVTGNRRFLRSKEYALARRLPNVHFLGYRDYGLLPRYLKGFDVCLLPYKKNEWTAAIYPNKLHQYLSAGKPVVSIGLPEVEHYRHVVYAADSYEEFKEYIGNALREDTLERQHLLMSVAGEHSTARWARQVIASIQRALS